MAETNYNANYIDIMVESLQKKEKILEKLIEKCDAQAEVIADNDYGSINWDKFNVLITEKEILIDRLNEIDDGFEALYDRVGDEIKQNKERYASQIKAIQELIKAVTDKGVTIKAKEERNRANLERVLLPIKKELKTSKRSMSVINKYYNTMNGTGQPNVSGWVDKKK